MRMPAATLLVWISVLTLLSGCGKEDHEAAPLSAQPELRMHGPIVLKSDCPPGFALNASNGCELATPYLQYGSLVDAGVGGLKTALPPFRDGFTPQQIDLGRYLFFDPVLSADHSMSCATCHTPSMGFSDGLPRSKGLNGQELNRAAPTIWNAGFLKSFFWDGRAVSLEDQLQGPLFDEREMGNTPGNLVATLNGIPAYRALFYQAFPKTSLDSIPLQDIFTALAAFETSLISLNSRYDQYAHGYHEALSPSEIEGLNVFRSFVARCAECHTPPLFTNQQLAVLGTPEPGGLPLDPGAQNVFNEPSLRAAFKVPTLRNIALTAPYMHSGVFADLRETVSFYNKGRGHAVPEGEKLKLHWHIWEPELSDYELDRLVDFLHTLTDESFSPNIPDHLPSGKDARSYLAAVKP